MENHVKATRISSFPAITSVLTETGGTPPAVRPALGARRSGAFPWRHSGSAMTIPAVPLASTLRVTSGRPFQGMFSRETQFLDLTILMTLLVILDLVTTFVGIVGLGLPEANSFVVGLGFPFMCVLWVLGCGGPIIAGFLYPAGWGPLNLIWFTVALIRIGTVLNNLAAIYFAARA